MRKFLMSLALAALALPAAAQTLPGTPAVEGTPEWLVGDAVLYFVGGRTREEAGGDPFNPFGIDPEAVLYHVGSFFIVGDFSGEPIKEGDLALYPQYAMPRGEGTPSAQTPPVIPFALLRQGQCLGGYVAGFPVPDTTYALDMTGALCHADTVEQMLRDSYAQATPAEEPSVPAEEPTEPVEEPTAPDAPVVPAVPLAFDPAFPRDLQLQDAVYAAYNAAYGLALADPDYAFWDGSDFAPARAAVTSALADANLGAITVAEAPADGPDAAKACAEPGITTVRLAFTPDRSGITVAAASDTRVYAYQYDYNISSDLLVTEVRDCATSGLGRAHSRSN
jgi:hypothetical protein